MVTSCPVAGLPERPGVYAFRDAAGRLLYVGKAINLKKRVGSYFRPTGGHSDMTRKIKDVAASVEHWEAGSELEALLAEGKAIRAGTPLFNIIGVRPGGPAFVRVTAEPVPRVLLTRRLEADGSRYYGPFRPIRELRGALTSLQPVLRWRVCKEMVGERCLYLQTDRCLGPCVPGALTEAGAYSEMLATLDRLLTGRDDEVRRDLEGRMHAEAAALRFERAALLRDSLAAVSRLAARAEALAQDGILVERWPSGDGARLLAIRSGRLVLARDVATGGPAAAQELLAFLEEAWTRRRLGPARTVDELREVESVCRYILRRRDERWVRVSRRRLQSAHRELCRRLGVEPGLAALAGRPAAGPMPLPAPALAVRVARPAPRRIPLEQERPFVAIDFETADGGADSACAVALVRVEADGSLETVSRLIRPPRRHIRFTYIHGIRWEDVAGQPTFRDVWPALLPMLEGAAFLAAHNASFDRNVLAECCRAAGFAPPDLPYVCTVALARRTWAIRPTKLDNVCDRLGIPLRHHDPASDAEACARIVLRAADPAPC